MPDTSRLALPYPQGTDVADVPSDVQVLAEAIDTTVAAWSTGIESARPAAGTAGRWYLASDSGVLYLDTGAAWLRMGPPELATPAGTVLWTAAEAAPTGYLIANGAAVSRTTFATLFAAIGTKYGAGDGSTTFNVPDLRGRAAIGAGQGTGLTNRALGQMPGSEFHKLTASQSGMPSHGHSRGTLQVGGQINVNTFYTGKLAPFAEGPWGNRGFAEGPFQMLSPGDSTVRHSAAPVWYHEHDLLGSVANAPAADAATSHPNMPPSTVLTPIIKT